MSVTAALMATIRLNLLRRPLMHPCMAEECLDISRPKLTALVESGQLPWAWNLGCGNARQEMRILAHCVMERATGINPAIGATKNLKLSEVLNLILPEQRQSLRAVELQRLFHASPDMIRDLGEVRAIRKISEKLPAVGPNASPRYARLSLVKFLTDRRIA